MSSPVKRTRAWEIKPARDDPLQHAHVSPGPVLPNLTDAYLDEEGIYPASITMAPTCAQAIEPCTGLRKKSYQYGDLSNIRPRSPCFELPSPADRPSSLASPLEYAERTDPFSPKRNTPPPNFQPSQGGTFAENRGGLSHENIGTPQPRPARIAQSPRYNMNATLTSPRQRQPFATSPADYIVIHGLSNGFQTTADVYSLIFKDRRGTYPAKAGGIDKTSPVEQLDICTLWKNVSPSLVDLIFMFDLVITPSLESLLQSQLQKLSQFSSQLYSPHKDVHLRKHTVHTVDFSFNALAERVYNRIHLQAPSTLTAKTREELDDLLLLYALSLECFESIPPREAIDTAITLKFREKDRASLTSSSLLSSVEVVPKWDFIAFDSFPSMVVEGDQLEIVPRYSRGALLKEVDQDTAVSYQVYPERPWFRSAENFQGFRGQIPLYLSLGADAPELYKEICPHTFEEQNFLRIEVLAVIEEHHPFSDLVLKRTLRARVSCKVLKNWVFASSLSTYCPETLTHRPHSLELNASRTPSPIANDVCLGHNGNRLPHKDPDPLYYYPDWSKSRPPRSSPSRRSHVCRKSMDCFPCQDEDFFASGKGDHSHAAAIAKQLPLTPGQNDMDVFLMRGVDRLPPQPHTVAHPGIVRPRGDYPLWLYDSLHCQDPSAPHPPPLRQVASRRRKRVLIEQASENGSEASPEPKRHHLRHARLSQDAQERKTPSPRIGSDCAKTGSNDQRMQELQGNHGHPSSKHARGPIKIEARPSPRGTARSGRESRRGNHAIGHTDTTIQTVSFGSSEDAKLPGAVSLQEINQHESHPDHAKSKSSTRTAKSMERAAVESRESRCIQPEDGIYGSPDSRAEFLRFGNRFLPLTDDVDGPPPLAQHHSPRLAVPDHRRKEKADSSVSAAGVMLQPMARDAMLSPGHARPNASCAASDLEPIRSRASTPQSAHPPSPFSFTNSPEMLCRPGEPVARYSSVPQAKVPASPSYEVESDATNLPAYVPSPAAAAWALPMHIDDDNRSLLNDSLSGQSSAPRHGGKRRERDVSSSRMAELLHELALREPAGRVLEELRTAEKTDTAHPAAGTTLALPDGGAFSTDPKVAAEEREGLERVLSLERRERARKERRRRLFGSSDETVGLASDPESLGVLNDSADTTQCANYAPDHERAAGDPAGPYHDLDARTLAAELRRSEADGVQADADDEGGRAAPGAVDGAEGMTGARRRGGRKKGKGRRRMRRSEGAPGAAAMA